MKPVVLLLLTMLFVISCSRVQESEDQAAASPSPPDLAAGERLSPPCDGCHGTTGIAEVPSIPSIAGQHIDYLVASMVAYKSGAREDEAMATAVTGLSEDDFRNLAALYSGMALPAGAGGTEAAESAVIQDPLARGQAASASCDNCHGADGNSTVAGTPSLAGLSDEYLVSAITEYKTSARAEPMMNAFAASLPVEDIAHMAIFYASQTPTARNNATAGDAETGKVAAQACAGCHGADGNSSDPSIPGVAGQDAGYLVKAINEYNSGARKHELMTSVVKALDGDEIVSLAAYYTAQAPVAPEISKPLSTGDWAEKCDRCHGPDGYSKDPRVPRLAGQHARYLSKSLHAYQNDTRRSSAMHAMASSLSDWEIETLSRYYSRK